MERIALVLHLLFAGALAAPLSASGSLIPIITPGYPYQAGDYGRAYDAAMSAGHIAIGPDGSLYFLDYPGPVLRRVTPDGQVLPVAGYGASSPRLSAERNPALLQEVGTSLRAVALDAQGNVFIAGLLGGIFRIKPDGIQEYYAAETPGRWYTWALAAAPSADLYALEAPYGFYGTQVLRIQPDGTTSVVAGTGTSGYSGDGGPAISAQIHAYDIAADGFGNIFLAGVDYVIRKVDPYGTITTIAQGGGPITVDATGNLYYFLTDGTLNRRKPDGGTDVVATVPIPGGIAVGSSGNIFVSAGGSAYSHISYGGQLFALSASGEMRLIGGCACYGDGVPVTWAVARNPTGVVQDHAGNLYISDSGNHTVRRMAPDGTITVIAGTGEAGYSGDGGLARQARLSAPSGLALDNAGNLYIAERGNSVVRRVTLGGAIQTVAGSGTAGFGGDGGPATEARMALPDGVAVDALGDIYIADTANHRIRKVTSDGIIHTIAGSDSYGASGDGGPASQALLINPRALVFDQAGNLLFTDSSAHMVRRITPAGIIQRVSGTGTPGRAGDGGPAASAQDWTPWGLAVDALGNVFIGDTGTYSIRIVDPSGTIQTLVSQTQATGLAADPNGSVWIAGTSGILLYSQAVQGIPLAPVIANKGIANSQTGQIAVIAPGEMVKISGRYLGPATGASASVVDGVLSTELAGVKVFFDDVAAPLLQVSDSQILAVVPFAVAGKGSVGVRVEYGGATSNTAMIGVLPAVPGIFPGGLNIPAAPGSIISLFVTGSGVMVPPEADGAVGSAQTSVPALPVSAILRVLSPDSVSVPLEPLEVTYAGSSTWLISGTIQVNLKLPDELPGPRYTGYYISVRVGDSLSPFVEVPLKGQ